jgi:hypothetical protein
MARAMTSRPKTWQAGGRGNGDDEGGGSEGGGV